MLSFATWAFQLAWPQFLFSHQRNPDAPRLYARVFTYFLAAMSLVWLTLSLLAQEIVRIMAHSSFHDSYRVVPWIAGAFLFEGLAYVGNIGMPLHRKVKYRPFIIGTVTALNIGLNLLLIPPYGAIGVAISIFASFVVKFVLDILVGYRLYAVPYEYGRLIRLGLVGLALYAAGISIAWGSTWMAVAGKTLLLLVFPVLLLITGFFRPGELARLKTSLTQLRWKPGARLARNAGK